ncbi:MAG: heparinase II/III family protein [Verrucomicrobia bacterium]|nr:heparinase II/III family protein [Verrucomicrobiota bacterium]
MNHRLIPLFLAAAALTASIAAGSDAGILNTLRRGHPRLLVLDADLARVKQAVESDPVARQWHEQLLRDAEKMLREKPVERVLIGPRLLDKSRTALHRISTLAGLYRLDGDRRFAERARKEMLAAAAFEDWNPKHFLDVAEMTNALAIGYDWLFGFLSAEDRATIRAAIVEKGLKQSLPIYEKQRWWSKAEHNWNQVCNGGMTVGALALADEEPALAAQIVAAGRASIVLAMRTFAPDGGWPEGPGYWNYATSYNVFYLAALETALDTDFGLKKMTGFPETGLFRIHFTSPAGLTFNYADAGEKAGSAAQMFWLARALNQPVYAGHERAMAESHPHILHLLWFDGRSRAPQDDDLPLAAIYRGVDVAFLRSAWSDPNAIFVGFKGGDNKANHSHLDLGSFVLDALGVRWAIDLGGDNYNLPGYFGKQRWSYYRLRTESHNTLTLDGENQDPRAAAPLVAFSASPGRSFAVADMTAAYAPKTTRAHRGVALLDRKQVLVQDELEASQPVEVVWNFLTKAKIEASGDRATLTQGRAKLEARILSPTGAKFEVISASPPPPQRQQPDVRNLTVRLPSKTAQARVAVLLSPAGVAGAAPKLEPLQAWIAAGKLPPRGAVTEENR